MFPLLFWFNIFSRGIRRFSLFRSETSPPQKKHTHTFVFDHFSKGGSEIRFMRTIAASGVGSYRLNDQEVRRDTSRVDSQRRVEGQKGG